MTFPYLIGHSLSVSPSLLWDYQIWPLLSSGRLPLVPLSGGFLSEMGVGFCQRLFLCLWRGSYGFYLQFVNVVYHTDGFVDIEERLHPWDKSLLIMMYNTIKVLLDVVC